MSYCKTQEFAFKKMGVEFQSYVILKRLELEVSAWSRFVEFLKLFKMLMDLKWKICVVFSQSWKTTVSFCSFEYLEMATKIVGTNILKKIRNENYRKSKTASS